MVVAAMGRAELAHAQSGSACRVLVYEYQPVPYDSQAEFPSGAPGEGTYEEGGPQVAIWLETVPPPGVSRGSFVADVFVTARTAVRGLGNRPGLGFFPSSPKFPYGSRRNVLPVWAFARGRDYPQLVMQDSIERSFGFHESNSTSEDFFCRPLRAIEVDGVTCPTPVFSSDKGRFSTTGVRSLYPPRGDVVAEQCHVHGAESCNNCRDSDDCKMLSAINDVAAVSGATPSPYQSNPPQRFIVPAHVPDGTYRVFIEVNKQYDQAAPRCTSPAECPAIAPHCDSSSGMCVRHLATFDSSLPNYGLGSNIGQPSVVWATTLQIDSVAAHKATADDYLGYGDWDFPRGNLFPPDDTISTAEGSGAGRLRRFTDGDGSWRFRVTSTPNQGTLPIPDAVENLAAEAVGSDTINVSFEQAGLGDHPVIAYEVRYRNGTSMSEEEFKNAAPGPTVVPSMPGSKVMFQLTQQEGILAQRTFTVGVRAIGECARAGPLRIATVTTPRQNFTTLEGCFVATAAYGSAMAAQVAMLRQFRDAMLLPSAAGRLLVRAYYAASPPLARLIAASNAVRAGTRVLLEPLLRLARGALGFRPYSALRDDASKTADH